MTTSIVIDAAPAPEPAATPPSVAPRRENAPAAIRFSGILRSERIKLSSLRSIRVTLLITVLVGLAMSALIASLMVNLSGGEGAFVSGDALGAQSYLLMIATFGAQFLGLVFGVLGVFAISSEYSSGMILSTLAAVPRRTPVFAAKALVLAAVSAVAALVIVLGGLVIAVGFAPEAAGEVLSLPVISGVLGTVAYLVLVALFAFGVAGLLRSTAGGISVAIGVVFVLPIVFQMFAATNWEWVLNAAFYLPSPLGGVLARGLVEAPIGPDFWGALVAMVLWAAVTLVPAAIVFKRRDAK